MESLKKSFRKIRNGELMVSYLHEVESFIIPKVVPDNQAVRQYCRKQFGNDFDIDHPRKFYEKLNWYKLHGKNPLMQKCANKVTLRDYVEEVGFRDCLNEIYGIYTHVEEIDLDNLPEKFVVKASHGTSMQIIVKDKSEIDWQYAKKLMKSWLRQDIYWRGREWVYKDMPRHIVVEKYIEDDSGELRDYKVFCFNGTPKFIQYHIGRFTKHIINYYYPDWTIMDMADYIGNDPSLNISAPKSLQRMLEIAKELSKPFQFVRVDFYEVQGRPIIGEMTFFPAGGSKSFIPDKWNNIVGDYWKLVE